MTYDEYRLAVGYNDRHKYFTESPKSFGTNSDIVNPRNGDYTIPPKVASTYKERMKTAEELDELR